VDLGGGRRETVRDGRRVAEITLVSVTRCFVERFADPRMELMELVKWVKDLESCRCCWYKVG
jgi:hypothetical protein